jgi:hypothetical protein
MMVGVRDRGQGKQGGKVSILACRHNLAKSPKKRCQPTSGPVHVHARLAHLCRIVQRSSWLSGGYGPDFTYREAMAPGGLLAAAGMSAFMAVIGAVFALRPLREAAKRCGCFSI